MLVGPFRHSVPVFGDVGRIEVFFVLLTGPGSLRSASAIAGYIWTSWPRLTQLGYKPFVALLRIEADTVPRSSYLCRGKKEEGRMISTSYSFVYASFGEVRLIDQRHCCVRRTPNPYSTDNGDGYRQCCKC